jgi:hypothetical protein
MAMKLGLTSKEKHMWNVSENKCGPKRKEVKGENCMMIS